MANTFTSINVAKVESEIVGALKYGLMPLDGVFTMGVGSDPKEKNETVTVPLITARTASTNATNYEDGNTTVTGKIVNLDTNISCSWHITAIQASKQDTDYFAKAAVEATHSVALAALQKALAINSCIESLPITLPEPVAAPEAPSEERKAKEKKVPHPPQRWD